MLNFESLFGIGIYACRIRAGGFGAKTKMVDSNALNAEYLHGLSETRIVAHGLAYLHLKLGPVPTQLSRTEAL